MLQKTISRWMIILAMITCIPFTANSQLLIALLFGEKLNSPNMEFGLDIGMNMSTIEGMEFAKYKSGLNFGIYLYAKLANNLYIKPMFIPKTVYGARNLPVYSVGDPALDAALIDSKVKRRLDYINFPIFLNYRTNFGLGFEAGPQIGLLTKSRDIFKTKDAYGDDNELVFENRNTDMMNRIDFGFSGGLTYKLKADNNKGINIMARYYYGILDMISDNTGAANRNSVFTFSVGIPIGTKSKESTSNNSDNGE